ncbi:uncharacterized protein [Panulirus ornatus]|uniref:uncharacterized protein n=1 Tax=Panulirus ornatus TaxID=150431 RepID=UPI003A896CED
MNRSKILNKWLASNLLLLSLLHGLSLASPTLIHNSGQHDPSTHAMSVYTPSPAHGQEPVDTVLATLTETPQNDDPNVTQAVQSDSDDADDKLTQSTGSEGSYDETSHPPGSEDLVHDEDSTDTGEQPTDSTDTWETVIPTVPSVDMEEQLLAQDNEDYDSDEWLLEQETCSTGASDENEDINPVEDTADIKKAYNRILEHVVGGPLHNSDPENMRLRAYMAHSKSHVIMGNVLDLWKRKLIEKTSQVLEDSEGKDGGDQVSGESEGGGDAAQVLKTAMREALENNSSVPKMVGKEATHNTTEITVVEGARLRLVCNVTGAHHYWVEWRRVAGLTFPDGSLVAGGRSVLLEYVAREDAGTYVCTARIPQGRTHSSALTIHVQYAPVVGVWARNVGETGVELGCVVEGHPRPSSAWYINNTKLSGASCHGNIEARSAAIAPTFLLSVVRVANTSAADFAYYHCRAANHVGVSRAYIMVHDDSGVLNLSELKQSEAITYTTTVDNPRLASFLLGMVPPLYIALYIIAYLSCYKTSISGMAGHGRFGANVDLDQ